MDSVEIQAFSRGVACGLRKLTTNHLIAARLAEKVHGLPACVKHPNQLLAAMRRAAPYLGYCRLLPLMEELFRWTQPQDWAPGDDPVVWPSNEDLAAALDCSERHVSRLIAAAIEAKLIVARDCSDRKRRGYRKNGRIVWAWGISLRPMAGRHADFVRAAQEGEAARLASRTLRRKAGAAQQTIAQLVELARSQNLPTHLLEDLYESARQIGSNLKRIGDPTKLTQIVGKLEALRTQATDWVERSVKSVNMSGSDDSHVGPILLTNKSQEPTGSTVIAWKEKALPPPQPHEQPPEPVPAKLNLAPTELVRLAPRLESCLLTDHPNWNDVADAAAVLSNHLGIPRSLYGEACRTLGRTPAAVAIAVISTKRPDYFHTSGPGGYLRGMLRRAERGQLFLDRSIFGLRDAAGYRRKQHDVGRRNWRPD
jgi:replication initiation protein RepC